MHRAPRPRKVREFPRWAPHQQILKLTIKQGVTTRRNRLTSLLVSEKGSFTSIAREVLSWGTCSNNIDTTIERVMGRRNSSMVGRPWVVIKLLQDCSWGLLTTVCCSVAPPSQHATYMVFAYWSQTTVKRGDTALMLCLEVLHECVPTVCVRRRQYILFEWLTRWLLYLLP